MNIFEEDKILEFYEAVLKTAVTCSECRKSIEAGNKVRVIKEGKYGEIVRIYHLPFCPKDIKTIRNLQAEKQT